jgi:predicted alpha/beta-fold hydrolase
MELAGHYWTIAPRLRHSLSPLTAPAGRPFALVVHDPRMGPVRLSGSLREPPGAAELVLVVHGLGGCADSHYMLRAGLAAEAAGLACLRLSLRGSDLRGEDYYHAGLTSDLHAVLAAPELARYRRLYLLGYSVGGHVVLRAATEPADPRLAAVAAICPPLDIGRSSAAFDAPGLWLYRRYVLGNMRRIYAAVAARRPVPLPLAEALRIRRLGDWDERVVAPRFGFAGAGDYYRRASVHPLLPELRLPALLAASERDPMVPAPTLRAALDRPAPRLEVRWLREGGHVAFPPGVDLGFAEARGLEAQVLGWLRRRGGAP